MRAPNPSRRSRSCFPPRVARALAPALALLLALATRAAADWLPQGMPVDTQPGAHASPLVVADGAGGAFIVWQHWDPVARVRLQHLDALGAPAPGWAAGGARISTGTAAEALSSAGADGSGGALAAWMEGGVLRARRVASDGTGAAGWADDGNLLFTPATGGVVVNDHVSGFAPDQQGGAWFLEHKDQSFCPDICYNSSSETLHHVGSGGAVDAVSTGVMGSSQLYGAVALVASTASGQALVAGYDGYAPSGSGAVRRYPSTSQSSWSGSLAEENLTVLALDDDGAGGAMGLTEAAFDIVPPRVIRRSSTGAVPAGWPSTGVPIRTPDTMPLALQGAGDGAGGMLVAWSAPGPTGVELRMQRVLADGSYAWPAEGVRVNASAADYGGFRIVADGAGGAFVAWVDRASDADGDLFASHVLGDGTIAPEFPPNGAAIALLPGRQANPSLATVSPGHAVVAWEDARDAAHTLVYAQMLPVPGTLDVPRPEPATLSLAGFVPNPSRGPLRVAFGLPRAGEATLELFDLSGRLVHRESLGVRSPGPHVVPLVPARPLAPGLYLVRLRALGEERVTRGLVTD